MVEYQHPVVRSVARTCGAGILFFCAANFAAAAFVATTATAIATERAAYGATEVYPGFTAPLVDAAQVVTDADEQRIDRELNDYRTRAGNHIAVAIVATTGAQSIEQYALGLANSWGVGSQTTNNGVVIVIAYADHHLRIEVGSGLHSALTDDEAQRIIDNDIAPQLKGGDVVAAVEQGIASIRSELDAGAEPGPGPGDARDTSRDGGDSTLPNGIPIGASHLPGSGSGPGSRSFPTGLFAFFGVIAAIAFVGALVKTTSSARSWEQPVHYGSNDTWTGMQPARYGLGSRRRRSRDSWFMPGTSNGFNQFGHQTGFVFDRGGRGFSGDTGGGGGSFDGGGASGSW